MRVIKMLYFFITFELYLLNDDVSEYCVFFFRIVYFKFI
jgi:hypothetical protein